MKKTIYLSSAALALLASADECVAHAIVGDRVFPATIAIDDPGVNDEMDTQAGRTNAGGSAWDSFGSAEFDKRLSDNFGVSVNEAWLDNNGTTGFDNVGVGAKYVFYKDAPHEVMFSSGLDWDIANTGAKRVADNFSTLTPAVDFGKGFGDLPDALDFIKPFAVTGQLGVSLPTDRYSSDDGDQSFNPTLFNWGGTLQYSVPYLQQHVKDIGLGAPFNMAVPIVEFSMQTPTGGDARETTGTINPGVLFMGHEMQVGFEAVVPVNAASGNKVGGIVQLHFYLDDMFPGTMKPIW